MYPAGNAYVQTLEAEGDGLVQRFLDRRGPGLHHVAFAVDAIDTALADLDARGVSLIDREARPGGMGTRIAFLRPSATGGVLVELVEEREETGHAMDNEALDPTHADQVFTGQHDRRKVTDWVCEEIREAIIDLRLHPGEPLREAAIAEQLGVSKTPIREALARLEQEGLVEVTSFKGAVVSGYSPRDLEEIYELRSLLEGAAVRSVAVDASEEARAATVRGHRPQPRAPRRGRADRAGDPPRPIRSRSSTTQVTNQRIRALIQNLPRAPHPHRPAHRGHPRSRGRPRSRSTPSSSTRSWGARRRRGRTADARPIASVLADQLAGTPSPADGGSISD